MRGRNAGLRLDHFLLSSRVAKRLIAAAVDRDVSSWEKGRIRVRRLSHLNSHDIRA